MAITTDMSALEEVDIENNCFKFILKYLFWCGLPVIPIRWKGWRLLLYRLASVVMAGGFFYMYSFLETSQTLYVTRSPIAIAHLFQHNLALVKVALIIYDKERIIHYLEKFSKNECKPDLERGGEQEFEYIKQASRFQKNIFFTCFGIVALMFFNLAMYILFYVNGTPLEHFDPELNVTVVSSLRMLPLTTYYPFDISNDTAYTLGFLYQYTSIFFMASFIAGIDSLFWGVMMQIHAQYRILARSLENFLERCVIRLMPDLYISDTFVNRYRKATGQTIRTDFLNTSVYEKVPEELNIYVRQVLKECVMHHQKIISLCEEAEEIFRYLMLLQILASLMIICFVLLEITSLDIYTFGFVSAVAFLLLMVFQLYMYCYCGQEVFTQSDSLAQHVYSVNWLPVDVSARKYLLMMMVRSMRPTQFTAGKFVRLSMPTFMSIVKTSGSYFTVLNSIRQ